jgi:hypothetical protein
MKGYVYILTNESMPGLVKIGRTSRSVEARANELCQTGVPTPFIVAHYVASPDCAALERKMHDCFFFQRVAQDREFFRTSVEEVAQHLDRLLREQVTEWVDDYAPGHVVTMDELALDEGDVLFLASELSAGFLEVALSIRELRPEELAPALDRYRQRRNRCLLLADHTATDGGLH